MNKPLDYLISAIIKERAKEDEPIKGGVITVSETVSVAASVYETIRNTLEFDEEHLLRRNAIRRILKRRLGEEKTEVLAADLLRELIWARYLPNNQVPESMVQSLAQVLDKYEVLFDRIETKKHQGHDHYNWLIDMLSTEIEYTVVPPVVDEALASFAYQELKKRMVWTSKIIAPEDQDMQLYLAVHRSVLKSNLATLRFRALTLFYPKWTKGQADSDVVQEVAASLDKVIDSIYAQINHSGADQMYRLVRKHAVVFHVLKDISKDSAEAFSAAVISRDQDVLTQAIKKAAEDRYGRFRVRLRRSVVRAVVFLFFTKMLVALLVEYPYEQLVLRATSYTPLITNVVFHPILLGVIGLTVRIPVKRNTQRIVEELSALVGLGTTDDFELIFNVRRAWAKGALAVIFNLIYIMVFLVTIGLLSGFLYSLEFNALSIVFFVFFLSLVMFFGLKIRNTKRELLVVEVGGGAISTFIDIIFLPI
ncbi:hypothetical protein ACFLZY_03410, partial [Patescibacteria group bacterium]